VASGENKPPPDALDYALTAEDLSFPDHPTVRLEDGGLELSIQLPGEREWTGDLLGWAIEHHARRQWLRGAIDFEKSARTLSEATGW
jgi:hypothetical protein